MAATAIIAAWSAVPVSAIELASDPEVAIAANDVDDAAVSPGTTSVPIPHRRPRTLRVAPVAQARPVAIAHRDWECSGFWCGRHFVLMLGIGY
jgi:hypothetical protein